MVWAWAPQRRKLSTMRLRTRALAHNRSMNEKSGAELNALGRFLTIADIAEILNVSISQAYALVRTCELPAIKVGGGGHWRVERVVLESYIEAKYEESRRRSLWIQSDFGNVSEITLG
ncbi:MAG: DNA-binding protein [Homoserinimonas sp.]|nr:DNA-binding protein [Homoserinimonas sp.]